MQLPGAVLTGAVKVTAHQAPRTTSFLLAEIPGLAVVREMPGEIPPTACFPFQILKEIVLRDNSTVARAIYADLRTLSTAGAQPILGS
eukprot:1767747-Amphidinium_carterae.1